VVEWRVTGRRGGPHHSWRQLALAAIGVALAGCAARGRLPAPGEASAAEGRPRFVEAASAAGITYRWTVPGRPPHDILQTIGSGCALLDHDRDGNLDLLLVEADHLALYRGNGRGGFVDVTRAAGLDRLRGHFLGCAVGDYDNDGDDDLYLSGYRAGALLQNRQGRAFTDVSRAVGLAPQPWGASAAFADLDGDRFLDLVVANYVEFGRGSPRFCPVRGLPQACGPGVYRPLPAGVYRNHAGRRFLDVARAWRFRSSGASLGVACADFLGSGRAGVAVANDVRPGDLFRNDGRGRFQNIGKASGTALSREGRAHAGMGLDWGDYDNDGRLDLFVTTYAAEAKCLYRSEGGGFFTERSVEAGIDPLMRPHVSFGCKFLDADNDGWLDLLIASGHVWDNPERATPDIAFRQPLKFLRNQGGGVMPVAFTDQSGSAGIDQLPRIAGRGLATGDFDNDGRIDALVVDDDGAPLLLRNETRAAGHWLGLRLVGTGKSNRNAYGAVVEARVGDRILVRICHADGSYLSASDPRVHLGLGRARRVDRVMIRWPDGRREARLDPPVDRYLIWTQGRGWQGQPTERRLKEDSPPAPSRRGRS
jgi:hypothetical protein